MQPAIDSSENDETASNERFNLVGLDSYPDKPHGHVMQIYNCVKTDVDAETPILWPPHAKIWLIGKDPKAGKDWGQEEKGTTEDEMAGWHHQLDGLGFRETLGGSDGQGGLACYDSWGHKELDTTERLNWTEQSYKLFNDLQYLCQIVKASSIKSAADIKAVLKWFSWDSAGLQAFFYQDKWDSQFKYIPESIHSLNMVKISLSLHLPIIYPPP